MDKIWLSAPHIGPHELGFVHEAFASNWVAPLGPNVDGFEQDLCQFTGAKHAAALSSGTAAIHLALVLLGVGIGDEVLCSTFTFSASCNPIVYQGATPIFVDSESSTWNICPTLLHEAIKDRIRITGKKPQALILVHLYGMPAQMDEIMEICKHYQIPVIEDAAEALGSSYKGKALGTFGMFGVLSFNGNKIITTSGGGALLSEDESCISKARFLATQARDNAPHYQHSEIGYNYRMSNICAGIGRGQMMVLNQRIEARRRNFDYYQNRLRNLSGISFLQEPSNFYSNRWLSCMIFNAQYGNNRGIREKIRLSLVAQNIETRPLWKPMHLQPIFEHYPNYTNGISEQLFDSGLCLPSGSDLSIQLLERVCLAIEQALK